MKTVTKLFQIHLKQLKGEIPSAEDLLQEITPLVLQEKRLPEVATWLWILVEQVERSKDKGLMTTYEKNIEEALNKLVEEWENPTSSLLGGDEPLVYNSNIGIYYGALNAAKRLTGRGELQKTITTLRDYIFSYGLSGGMVVQAQGIRKPSPDLLFTVMPFGLFSPEDLVMVEAVKEMEKILDLSSPITSGMLAWYYTEKKNIKPAKDYVKKTEEALVSTSGTEKELGETILDIVRFYLESFSKKEATITINHQPHGNDNPYEKLRVERSPREPQEGQEVKVFAEIWPDLKDMEVHVAVNTGDEEYEVSCSKSTTGEEGIWRANLGDFQFQQEVSYRFLVRQGNQLVKEGATHTFYPLKSNSLAYIEDFWLEEGTLWVKGQDRLNIKPVYLGFSIKNDAATLQIEFENPSSKSSEIMGANEKGDIRPALAWEDMADYLIIFSKGFSCRLEKNPFNIRVTAGKGKEILKGYNKTFPVLQWWINKKGEILRTTWNLYSPLEERFYGLGERFDRLEYRGTELDCYVYNQYRDQGNKTYMPVPFYISSKGYGLLLRNNQYSVFDFASKFQDLLSISTDLTPHAGSANFTMFTGETKEICQKYALATGKPVLPPVWAFGPWMSSNNWDRDSIVREQVEKTNGYKIPSTVLVLEQWSDESTYYIFNDAEYPLKSGKEHLEYEDFTFPQWGRWPDPKGLMDYLHDNGLKVLLWQIPIQKYLNRQSHLQKDADEEYMLKMGYEVKNADGTPYRIPEGWFTESLIMDFSNAAGREWWFNKRKYLLDIGVDGFKTDGGEFVFGKDLIFNDGKTGAEMRNLYPNDYIEAYYKFVTEYHKGEGLTFSRAGFTGAQNFPCHWAGDERSTFDAFRHSMIAGLSSGLSGIPFWGWDLAGFNGDIPTSELFIRSAAMAAFCPIMQYHAESKGEFNQDRTPWNIAERTGDERVLEGYAYYANLRMNLLPHIYHEARRSSETGIPMMRPLMMEFPQDESCHGIYHQYMFGDDLLVAPVMEEGAGERMVYFPEGEWISLWHHGVIKGPQWKLIKAPLMEIPVFSKVGSALLCNCNEDLTLGSWVGNRIDAYQVPVLRLYPKDKMKVEIIDHLENKWNIEILQKERELRIDITTDIEFKLLIPIEMIKVNKLIINGIQERVNMLEKHNDYYIISLQ